MNVAVVSEFRPGYRPALEECYARGFEAFGHQVARVGLHQRLAPGRGPLGRLATRLGAGRVSRAVCDEVLAAGVEAVVIVKGAYLAASTVSTWRARGVKVANVFPDNPFDAMAATGHGDGLLGQLRACDRVYAHDRFVVGQLRQLGVQSDFIAFARDPDLHDRAHAGSPQPGSPPVVFVGNPDPERIRFLRAVADLGLGLWGRWDWARLPAGDPLAACVRGPELLGRDMARCLAAAAVSINLLRPSQKTAHNMRTFESPACGVCTLSEASNGVLELMEDGSEVVTFRTPEDLRRETLALLEDPERRARIAEAGWRRVEPETYQARAGRILSDLR